MGWLKPLLNIFSTMLQNSRDAELKADGARKGELERRDKQDEIRAEAKESRKVNNSDTDADVRKRL